jgi:hypothetical protein
MAGCHRRQTAGCMIALVSVIIAGSATGEIQCAPCPDLTAALSRIAELEEEVAWLHTNPSPSLPPSSPSRQTPSPSRQTPSPSGEMGESDGTALGEEIVQLDTKEWWTYAIMSLACVVAATLAAGLTLGMNGIELRKLHIKGSR